VLGEVRAAERGVGRAEVSDRDREGGERRGELANKWTRSRQSDRGAETDY
jgi:hypothetical protein